VNPHFLDRNQLRCSRARTFPNTHPDITPFGKCNCKNLLELKVRYHGPLFSTYCFNTAKTVTQTNCNVTFIKILHALLFFVILHSCVYLCYISLYTHNSCVWLSNCYNIIASFTILPVVILQGTYALYGVLHCVCVHELCSSRKHDTQLTVSVWYMDWDNTVQYMQHNFLVCS
jgi:hypothetical protein